MAKIGSCLFQQPVLLKTSIDQTFIKDENFQIHSFSPFESHCLPQKRPIKAIYAHFFQGKRKHKPSQESVFSQENLNRKELILAMDEAKNAYEKMREIQEQLNHTYKELMCLKSN